MTTSPENVSHVGFSGNTYSFFKEMKRSLEPPLLIRQPHMKTVVRAAVPSLLGDLFPYEIDCVILVLLPFDARLVFRQVSRGSYMCIRRTMVTMDYIVGNILQYDNSISQEYRCLAYWRNVHDMFPNLKHVILPDQLGKGINSLACISGALKGGNIESFVDNSSRPYSWSSIETLCIGECRLKTLSLTLEPVPQFYFDRVMKKHGKTLEHINLQRPCNDSDGYFASYKSAKTKFQPKLKSLVLYEFAVFLRALRFNKMLVEDKSRLVSGIEKQYPVIQTLTYMEFSGDLREKSLTKILKPLAFFTALRYFSLANFSNNETDVLQSLFQDEASFPALEYLALWDNLSAAVIHHVTNCVGKHLRGLCLSMENPYEKTNIFLYALLGKLPCLKYFSSSDIDFDYTFDPTHVMPTLTHFDIEHFGADDMSLPAFDYFKKMVGSQLTHFNLNNCSWDIRCETGRTRDLPPLCPGMHKVTQYAGHLLGEYVCILATPDTKHITLREYISDKIDTPLNTRTYKDTINRFWDLYATDTKHLNMY